MFLTLFGFQEENETDIFSGNFWRFFDRGKEIYISPEDVSLRKEIAIRLATEGESVHLIRGFFKKMKLDPRCVIVPEGKEEAVFFISGKIDTEERHEKGFFVMKTELSFPGEDVLKDMSERFRRHLPWSDDKFRDIQGELPEKVTPRIDKSYLTMSIGKDCPLSEGVFNKDDFIILEENFTFHLEGFRNYVKNRFGIGEVYIAFFKDSLFYVVIDRKRGRVILYPVMQLRRKKEGKVVANAEESFIAPAKGFEIYPLLLLRSGRKPEMFPKVDKFVLFIETYQWDLWKFKKEVKEIPLFPRSTFFRGYEIYVSVPSVRYVGETYRENEIFPVLEIPADSFYQWFEEAGASISSILFFCARENEYFVLKGYSPGPGVFATHIKGKEIEGSVDVVIALPPYNVDAIETGLEEANITYWLRCYPCPHARLRNILKELRLEDIYFISCKGVEKMGKRKEPIIETLRRITGRGPFKLKLVL